MRSAGTLSFEGAWLALDAPADWGISAGLPQYARDARRLCRAGRHAFPACVAATGLAGGGAGRGISPWQQEERESNHADGNEHGERGGKSLGNHMLGLPVMTMLGVDSRVRQNHFSGASRFYY